MITKTTFDFIFLYSNHNVYHNNTFKEIKEIKMMERNVKLLSFYIALDNDQVSGLDSFKTEEIEMFRSGAERVETSKGTYQKYRDTTRVLSRDEARQKLTWGKWESPRPVPIRELEYIAA